MTWKVPRMWENEDVWILGGGSSLPLQFDIPSKVIQDVIDRKSSPGVYSPYMSVIHNKHVIGVNMAFLIGEWMDIIFFGDNGFFLQYQSQLAIHPSLKVTCSPIQSSRVDWVKSLDKDKEHVRGLSTNPRKVSWNCNSGAAAINLAVHTGAKRIILLGFDMCLNDNKNQHWHDIYQRGKIDTPDKWKKMQPTFERHLRGFKQIAIEAKMLGVEILNCSPTSVIKEFPKVNIQDLL